MTVFQCKMCGGTLHLTKGSTIAQCEYCGVRQTVPLLDDDKKAALFQRANRLLGECDFEKASVVYESIVADYPREPEAYWGLLLCEYGIEYVDDPKSGKKHPTCHRASYQSFLAEGDYQRVLEYASPEAAEVYRREAERIEFIRKEMIAIASREECYDIFISYKEKDNSGERTIDSVLAQELYKELTAEGYRVFFSRITLEKKLGVQYEPYIFAALQSAKVMLVVGTEPEHFQSVWVKNEWNRFLRMMSDDRSKHMIPCYKNMSPTEMPREFAVLQGQDLGKIGAVQDLLWGIQKLIPNQESSGGKENTEPRKQKVDFGTVAMAAMLFFFAILGLGMTGSSLETSGLSIFWQGILNLVATHLSLPIYALLLSLYVRGRNTPGNIKAVYIASIVLSICLALVSLAIFMDIESAYITGTDDNSVFCGLIPAVTFFVLYRFVRKLINRICNAPTSPKK